MTICLISFFPNVCFGALAITTVDDSSIVHDQSITITGTDFTSKATAAPIKYENFDSGSDGSTIAGSAAYGDEDCSDCWSDYKALAVDGAEDPKYSNLNNRTNSALTARFHYVCDSVNYSDSILCWEGSKTITDKVFVSFWIRMDWGTTTDTSYQAKMFWVGESGLYGYPGFRLNAWQNASTTNDSYFLGLFLDVAGTQSNPTDLKVVGDNVNPLGEASWTLVQIWVQGASDSSGEVHVRFYDPYDDNQRTALDYTGITLSESGWKDFVFGRAMTNVDSPADIDTTHYYDDIYIDDSWARVEIGNASTYSACTNLEVCPAASWSTTSITFTAKVGSQSGDAWVYVTDIDGNVSPGYAITVITTPDIQNVSGTIAHNQPVTITGYNFGTKTTAAPEAYADFESAVDGLNTPSNGTVLSPYTDLDTDGVWCNNRAEANRPAFSTSASRHSNTTYNALFEYYHDTGSPYPDQIATMLIWNGDTTLNNSGGTAFTSFWVKMKWPSLTAVNDYQFKFWRFTGNDYNTSGALSMTLWWIPTHEPEHQKTVTTWKCDTCAWDDVEEEYIPGIDDLSEYQNPVFTNDVEGEWCLFQYWATLCESGESGSIHWRILRPELGTNIVVDISNIDNMRSDEYLRDSCYSVDLVDFDDNIDGKVYIDDIYYDTSLARVEIGNNSSYESCTQREMLIPSAWSTTSITATLYPANLTGTNYIFVVDPDGNVSPGYPVTIEGAAASGPAVQLSAGVTLSSGVNIQ